MTTRPVAPTRAPGLQLVVTPLKAGRLGEPRYAVTCDGSCGGVPLGRRCRACKQRHAHASQAMLDVLESVANVTAR